MLIGSFIVALALIGAFATAVFIIKKSLACTYEYAWWFIAESVKDLIYGHYTFWLNYSDFPIKLHSDIETLVSDEVKKQWAGILNMNSKQTEAWGVADGTSYYSFVIPWKDEYEQAYISMIHNLGALCLSNAKCTIQQVKVDFFEWDLADYRICRVRYARTAAEQEPFKQIQEKEELDSVGGSITEIHDSELDKELDLFETEEINVNIQEKETENNDYHDFEQIREVQTEKEEE